MNNTNNPKTIDQNNCDFVFRKTETSDSKVMMGELIENNIMTDSTWWLKLIHVTICFCFSSYSSVIYIFRIVFLFWGKVGTIWYVYLLRNGGAYHIRMSLLSCIVHIYEVTVIMIFDHNILGFFLYSTSVDTEMCCPKGKCGCQYYILLTLKKIIHGHRVLYFF